jgi:uncharacterized alkaline shock family protein YloU
MVEYLFLEVDMKDKNLIPGTVEADLNVILDMIGYAALESYGVAGMATPSIGDGIAKLLPVSKLRRGILLKNHDGEVSVDIYVIIQHQTNLSAVAENLVSTVKYTLEEYAQIPVKEISIHIQGIKIK